MILACPIYCSSNFCVCDNFVLHCINYHKVFFDFKKGDFYNAYSILDVSEIAAHLVNLG